MSISGMFPATTTPFAADGGVSLPGVKKNIALYNQTGLAGYVVLGSTGEAVMLSREEADAVLIAAKEAAAPGRVLIAGTGAESTAETIARTRRAAALGYEFALVKTPYYYKPFYRPETFIQHYRAVADASPIPVLLYSVPIFTGITLDTPEILTLAEHPNIVGIKDSSSVIQRVSEVVGSAPADFHLVTGGAAVVYPALVVGARGAILALASAFPEKFVELYDLFRAGQHERAKTLQHQLALASKRIIFENGIAGLKFAMELRGYYGGAPRLPMLPLKDEKKQAISALVAELHPVAARV